MNVPLPHSARVTGRRRNHTVAILAVDRDASVPLSRQLYERYRDAIVEGRIAAGQRLPSTRTLSDELGVGRITVVAAFEQLSAEGYLEGRRGSGTYVASTLPEELAPRVRTWPAGVSGRGARRTFRSKAAERLEEARAPWLEGVLPFRLSVPALDQLPFRIWARLSARHARNPKQGLLRYGDPMGHRPLREALATHLRASRGVRCDAGQVMIVSGSQQALDLCARVLIGDRPVWVEDPGYVGARNAFRLAGAKVVPVRVDAQGIDVRSGIARCPTATAAYVTPSHQYPLGVVMSAPRRLELLDWARRGDAWIIEDDYDSEYRYDSQPITALQGLDRHERVLYVGTFSKVLFPSLRLGYLVLPPDLVEPFARVRDAVDVFPAALHQAVLADFLVEGHFSRHLRRMRVLYRERRGALLQELATQLGDRCGVVGDGAGMHVVITLDRGLDDREVSAVAARLGTLAMPLSSTFAGRPSRQGLVLGYAGFDERRLREGVVVLKQAIERVERSSRRRA